MSTPVDIQPWINLGTPAAMAGYLIYFITRKLNGKLDRLAEAIERQEKSTAATASIGAVLETVEKALRENTAAVMHHVEMHEAPPAPVIPARRKAAK